jgi:hypothetical protein
MTAGRSVYLAGKMRGVKNFAFDKFDKARDELLKDGWEVISPADIDREVNGFDPFILPDDYDWNTVPDTLKLDELIERDLKAVRECSAIYMLKGWETSLGARAEHAVAMWAGKLVIYEAE